MRDKTVDKMILRCMDNLESIRLCGQEYGEYMVKIEDDETMDAEDYETEFEELIGNELHCQCVDSLFF